MQLVDSTTTSPVTVSRAQETFALPLTEIEIRQAMLRVLASSIFTAEEKLSSFLSFAVSAALNGNLPRLSDNLGTDGDKQIGNVMRNESRMLREYLQKYYSSDGRADLIVIEIPRGGYAPGFRRRDTPRADLVESSPIAPAIRRAPQSLLVKIFVFILTIRAYLSGYLWRSWARLLKWAPSIPLIFASPMDSRVRDRHARLQNRIP